MVVFPSLVLTTAVRATDLALNAHVPMRLDNTFDVCLLPLMSLFIWVPGTNAIQNFIRVERAVHHARPNFYEFRQ